MPLVSPSQTSPGRGCRRRPAGPGGLRVDPGGYSKLQGPRTVPGTLGPPGRQRRRGPTVVALAGGTGGLPADCVALCHQITTLDRSKLTQRIGALPEPDLLAVEEGIRAAVDLDS